jgi:hypothetical protein
MLLEVTVALVVAAALGLAFESARWVGAVGMLLLIFIHPWACLALSIAGSVAVYFIRFHKRRTYDALPERYDRSN